MSWPVFALFWMVTDKAPLAWMVAFMAGWAFDTWWENRGKR